MRTSRSALHHLSHDQRDELRNCPVASHTTADMLRPSVFVGGSMSDWAKIKRSPEYREAADDVEERIRRHLRPAFKKLDEVAVVVEELDKRVAALEKTARK
jgi:hypothetical protein